LGLSIPTSADFSFSLSQANQMRRANLRPKFLSFDPPPCTPLIIKGNQCGAWAKFFRKWAACVIIPVFAYPSYNSVYFLLGC
jgi:hypothetical protein